MGFQRYYLRSVDTMPPVRRGNNNSSCCCSTHRYLCPTHRDNNGDIENIPERVSCWWEDCKKPVIGMIVVIACVLAANYFIKQNDALAEMQSQMQKELKEIVDNQNALLNSVQDGGGIRGRMGMAPDNEALKDIIKREINAYDADKIAQVDYALESAGGRILSILTTKPYVTDESLLAKGWNILMTTFCKDGNADTARPILQPKMAPGECWAFEGSQGSVMIKLLAKIHVHGITIEHIPAAISPSAGITSAPKVFNLWGLKCRDDSDAFLFGEFTYNNESTPIQYFEVQHQSNTPYDIVLLKILSNWGNQQYTCVYRVRIHGELYQQATLTD